MRTRLGAFMSTCTFTQKYMVASTWICCERVSPTGAHARNGMWAPLCSNPAVRRKRACGWMRCEISQGVCTTYLASIGRYPFGLPADEVYPMPSEAPEVAIQHIPKYAFCENVGGSVPSTTYCANCCPFLYRIGSDAWRQGCKEGGGTRRPILMV